LNFGIGVNDDFVSSSTISGEYEFVSNCIILGNNITVYATVKFGINGFSEIVTFSMAQETES
jgi:hypothetical protein